MYVVLLDRYLASLDLKFMAAIHARLAGNKDVEVPDLETERILWDEWLESDPPAEAMRTKDERVLYAALFPDNPTGMSTEDAKRKSMIDQLRDMGHVTEVHEDGSHPR